MHYLIYRLHSLWTYRTGLGFWTLMFNYNYYLFSFINSLFFFFSISGVFSESISFVMLSKIIHLGYKIVFSNSECNIDFFVDLVHFIFPIILLSLSVIDQNVANVGVWFDILVEISDQVGAFFS